MILVSSTEPATFHSLGKLTITPEKYGVDFFWTTGPDDVQRWGVQRKELNDLIASLSDDRLAKETAQIAALHRAVLVIEGKLRWTPSGELILKGKRYKRNQGWTKQAFTSMLLSLQDRGWWLVFTKDQIETAKAIKIIEHWSTTDHDSLNKRSAMQSPWGKGTDKEFACWVLQSAPGIGPKMAKDIYEALGPIVAITATDDELSQVKGVGAKTIENLRRAFG